MQSETRVKELKAERDELEREFEELAREAQKAACLRQINARKQNRLMERIEEIEKKLDELRGEDG